MARSPILSNYPRLHSLLRADPSANNEFQSLVSSMRGPQVSPNANLTEELEKTREQGMELLKKQELQEKQQAKLTRFIKLLGEVVEGQTQLRPYSQDVSEEREYNIKFTPGQIRMLLHAFWDIVGEDMEKQINKSHDPASAREED